jgi:hypothetical protein
MTSPRLRPLRALGYGLYALLDHGCWLLIKLLPGPQLIGFARRRPWRRLQLPLSSIRRQRWLGRIAWLLRTRSRRAGWGSTCLSRSISGRLLLDLIGVANELHLGMSKFSDGRKVPHAWLRDPRSGRLFTPGLTPGAGAPLTHF